MRLCSVWQQSVKRSCRYGINMSKEKYNPEKVGFYLKCIDATNQKAEEKIERIRERRDKEVDMYEQLIIKEREK